MQPQRESFGVRVSRMLWAVTDRGVRLVQGFACPDPDDWWCPEVGFTGRIGRSLFSSERGALAQQLEEASQRHANAAEALRTARQALHQYDHGLQPS